MPTRITIEERVDLAHEEHDIVIVMHAIRVLHSGDNDTVMALCIITLPRLVVQGRVFENSCS